MSTGFIDAETALAIGVRLAGVSLLISATEQLTIRKEAFGPTGPFSESVARVFGRSVVENPLLRRAFAVAPYSNLVAATAIVALGPFGDVGPVALVVALIGAHVVRWRRVFASDGAEQMTTLVLLAGLLAAVPFADHRTVRIAVWFIAGQAVLAYTSAGLAKAFSSTWRSGAAVPIIMGSEAHGHPTAARVFAAVPLLGKAATWSVIAFECSFFLAVLGPWPLAVGLLAAGAAFHIGCAILMGLNSFVWAFAATYASVWYAAAHLSPLW
jgi:hypothetical protein